MFASPTQLNFLTTSRRDDLVSLAYIMAYYLNPGFIDYDISLEGFAQL
jgi:hypothetical protein